MESFLIFLLVTLICVIAAFLYATWKVYRFLRKVEEDVTNEVMKTKQDLSRNLDAIFEFKKTTPDGREIKEAKKIDPDEDNS